MGLGSIFGGGSAKQGADSIKFSEIIEILAPGVSKKEGTVAALSNAREALEGAQSAFKTAHKNGNSHTSLLLNTLIAGIDSGQKSLKIYPGDRKALAESPFTFDGVKDTLEQLKEKPTAKDINGRLAPLRPSNEAIDRNLAALAKVETLFDTLKARFPQPAAAPAAPGTGLQ